MSIRWLRFASALPLAAGTLGFAAPAYADQCPDGQVSDVYGGQCVLAIAGDSWDEDEDMQLFTAHVGPTYPGGQVPSVSGIPCTPEHYGTCIGLSQNQRAHTQPRSTISHSP
jgi:hypothetical protein